ncbi:MAG: hypothetical protein HY910_08230 [Desulfarculus sp.]|nr:hypothetical protein [Desulfarculus sp.]
MEALGTLVFGILPHAALAVLLGGCAWRLWGWAATPEPWPQPLTPAPAGRAGVAWRFLWQALAMPALWRANPILWALVWLLHLCLLLTFLHHLRLFVQPVPEWLMALRAPGRLAGHLLPLLLLILLMRRLAGPVLRRLSVWEDYLAPALLLALSLSGLAMHSLERPPLVEIKALALGLVGLRAAPSPPAGLFWLHFLLALGLCCYLPWGKLMHGAGLWLSPGLGQPDSLRSRAAAATGQAATLVQPGPPETSAWGPEEYRAALKNRWAGAGVHRVMGARERAQSLTGHRQWPGPGGDHGR